jgi:3-hydroxybutyryl-CoA dehydrogenase
MQLPTAIPAHWKMPVLINDTTGAFQLPAQDNRPIARFCGWNTMIERPTWEIAMYNQASTSWLQGAELVLNRKLNVVSNRPGFIAPRVVAAIINEACYGLADKICTANDLDLAMRLGTNYPRGPIAWMQEIGKENILILLTTLALEEERYKPHPLLHSEKQL